MKILTNIRFYHLAGMSQTTQSFLSYFRKQERDMIVGVNLTDGLKIDDSHLKKECPHCHLISQQIQFPDMRQTTQNCKTVQYLEKNYQQIIDTYRNIIRNEKPDAIVINGTYFLPWCLYRASLDFRTKRFLHYHGILTKEIAHWDKDKRYVFEQMEKTFDNKDLFYIFPSVLAKTTVENEVFKHKIDMNFSIIPNHIFFKPILKDKKKRYYSNAKKNIGAVTRWTAIKNPLFLKKIAALDLKHGDRFDFHVITDLSDHSPMKKRLGGLLNFQSSMDHVALKKYYNKMDVILSPSHFETYGNVAQEAIVHGTPALVSSNMGVAETFVKFGLNHWIIDFHSTPTVYNKIQEASHEKVNYELRRLMAADYAPHKIHKKMLSVIKSN